MPANITPPIFNPTGEGFIRLKPLWASQGVWAAIIAIACALVPFLRDKQADLNNMVPLIVEHKAAAVCFLSGLGALFGRLAAIRFNVALFKTKTFWLALPGFLAAFARLGGVDLNEQDMQDLVTQGQALLPAAGSILATLWVWFGRAKAAKALTFQRC